MLRILPAKLPGLLSAFLAAAIFAPTWLPAAAVSPELLKDIYSRPQNSSTIPYVPLGDQVIFPGFDLAHGSELWRTDGTPEGTFLLADISPGSAESAPASITKAGDFCYFAATSAPFPGPARELWKTDGTAQGTSMVKDIHPTGSSSPSLIRPWGGRVFFTANDGTHGTEPWISDGTEAGTFLLKDISPGTSGSIISSNGSSFTALGSKLYFVAGVAGEGILKLHKTDGTGDGTVVVGNGVIHTPSTMLVYNGNLYMIATGVSNGQPGIWKADAATDAVVKIASLTGTSYLYNASMAVMGGQLYFTAPLDYAETDLYKTNGTAAGTTLVKKLGRAGGLRSFSGLAGAAQEALYFSSSDSQTGVELWKSDGTSAGTQRLMDLNPGTGDSYPGTFVQAGNRLFFRADRGDSWRHLWITDGSAGGTRLLKEFTESIGTIVAFGKGALVSGTDATYGREMWYSNGTAAGTTLVRDFRGSGSSDPWMFANVGERLYFVAKADSGYRGIHLTDGTPEGTRAAGKFNPYTDVVHTSGAFGNQLLMGAELVDAGTELCKTDGTAPGTVVVKHIRAGSYGSVPQLFTDMGGYCLFTADDGVNGRELWRTDGTTEGTALLKDIVIGSSGSSITAMARAGNQAFFVSAGRLWKTDGTEANTSMVDPFLPLVHQLATSGNLAFFSAQDGTFSYGLWRSDGTAAGSYKLASFASRFFSTPGSGFQNFAGKDGVIYIAGPGPGLAPGIELWRSDGTVAGTYRLLQRGSDALSIYAPGLSMLGDRLLFWLKGSSGFDLWSSDGTATGTRLVRHLPPPGADLGFAVHSQVSAGGRIWFIAGDGESGFKLWTSDGTTTGTGPVPVLAMPGVLKSGASLRMAGSHLVFPLETDSHGVELFRISLGDSANGADPYASWAEGSGLGGSTAEPDAVPHADGVANLLKYAFFMDGTRPDRTMLPPGSGIQGLPVFSMTGSGPDQLLRVEYIRRRGSGLNYVPKISATLQGGSFVPMGGTETVHEIDVWRERVVREQAVDLAETPRLFGTVEVTPF